LKLFWRLIFVLIFPEDVANAIRDGVKNHKPEVLVGLANLSHGLYRLFPGLLQWGSRQALKNQDK
jgi:hypothetical protein